MIAAPNVAISPPVSQQEAAPCSPPGPVAREEGAPLGILDVLFLAVVFFVPALVYLPGLGFYSDDWGFLGDIVRYSGTSPISMLAQMLTTDLRPFLGEYVALL